MPSQIGSRFSAPDGAEGFLRQPGIHQDEVIPGVDHIVLQRAAVTDVVVIMLGAVFPAERHPLGIKALFKILYGLDDHETNAPFCMVLNVFRFGEKYSAISFISNPVFLICTALSYNRTE